MPSTPHHAAAAHACVPNHPQVVSVHGMSQSLHGSVVASYGERLLVFDAKPSIRTGSVLHDAQFHFVAHPKSNVSCLARSGIEGSSSLFSAAQDGSIHM